MHGNGRTRTARVMSGVMSGVMDSMLIVCGLCLAGCNSASLLLFFFFDVCVRVCLSVCVCVCAHLYNCASVSHFSACLSIVSLSMPIYCLRALVLPVCVCLLICFLSHTFHLSCSPARSFSRSHACSLRSSPLLSWFLKTQDELWFNELCDTESLAGSGR